MSKSDSSRSYENALSIHMDVPSTVQVTTTTSSAPRWTENESNTVGNHSNRSSIRGCAKYGKPHEDENEIELSKRSSSNHGGTPLRSLELRVTRSRWQGRHSERRRHRLDASRRSAACRPDLLQSLEIAPVRSLDLKVDEEEWNSQL